MDLVTILLLIIRSLAIIFMGIIVSIFISLRNKLLKHPNQIFFAALVCETFATGFEMIQVILRIVYGQESNLANIIDFVSDFAYIYMYHYIVVLYFEILVKITKSISQSYSIRVKLYHFFVFVISGVLTITIIISANFGKDNYEVDHTSCYGSQIVSYYLIVTSIFMFICAYIFFKKRVLLKSSQIVNLIIMSFLIIISIYFSAIIVVFRAFNFNRDTVRKIYILSLFFIGLSGIIQFVVFISDRKFRQAIKKHFKVKILMQESEFIESFRHFDSEHLSDSMIDPLHYRMSSQGASLSEFFENITKNSLISVFVMISLLFLDEKHKSFKSSKRSFSHLVINNFYREIGIEFVKKISFDRLRIKEYCPAIFRELQLLCNCSSIKTSLFDPSNYEKLVNLVSVEGGRSGAFIYLTTDSKFVIKTISKCESKILLSKLLPYYIKRLTNCPQSRLTRIYGVYKIYPMKQRVIIMENILYKKNESWIFDLKGSRLSRKVKGVADPLNPPKSIVLKDINFEEYCYEINLQEQIKKNIVKVLKDDFLILKNLKIMDYSVLLAICNEKDQELNRFSIEDSCGQVLSIGIIDFFQEYNLKKVGEKAVKSMLNKTKDISTVSPEEYYKRICDYIDNIFR
ncbi:hypothetical protein SteCoe_17486 [Stentor coeruleus]|uniref:PIPK domain-containing protein n=1 Tax=Stentor coeruleus TaxID=5963 RepID=A0A1R2BYT1_9CILI|nr:hypothetical protein SteCoe_17486 [Stentor coeruleus]